MEKRGNDMHDYSIHVCQDWHQSFVALPEQVGEMHGVEFGDALQLEQLPSVVGMA